MKYIYLLVLCVFLVGCSQNNITENATQEGIAIGDKVDASTSVVSTSVDSNMVDAKASVVVGAQSAVENKTICVAEWICLSAKTKIYREGNCSFTLRQECKFGCKNNTCAPAPVCTSGWNCDGNYYRGYRLESCEFEKKEKCEFGCKDAVCLNESVKTASVEVAQPVVEQKTVSATTLNLGKTIVLKNHNVSIYAIDSEQVMLSVDGKKSKFLKQGETFTRGDLSIVVEEIYFQAFNTGKRMISYSVK